jgi:hypothetical protein
MKRYFPLALALLGMAVLTPLAFAEDPIVTRLSPEAIKNMQNVLPKPSLNRDVFLVDGVDLSLTPIKVEVVSRTPLLRFRVYSTVTNLGKTASTAGRATTGPNVEVRILPWGTADRGGTATPFALRSLRSWDSQIVGIEGEWNPKEPKALLAQMYDATTFRLIRGDTSVRAGSTYTDARNTNNTVTLSGDELVRLLGL